MNADRHTSLDEQRLSGALHALVPEPPDPVPFDSVARRARRRVRYVAAVPVVAVAVIAVAVVPAVVLNSSPDHGPATRHVRGNSPSTGASTTCAFAYTVHAPGHTLQLGTCGGGLGMHPATLRIRHGRTFELTSITEQSGEPDFRAPTTNNAAVVIRTAVSGRGGDGRYQATGHGTATLSTSSIFCDGGPRDTSATGDHHNPPLRICPVLRVIVTN